MSRRCGRAATSAGCTAAAWSERGEVVAITAAGAVYALTRSPLAVGLLSLTSAVGMLASVLAGGMLADRYDRRTLLLATGAPQALLAAALMANALLRHPALWAIFVITLAMGMLAGLGSPARPRPPRPWWARPGWPGRGAERDGQPARQPVRSPDSGRPDRRARARGVLRRGPSCFTHSARAMLFLRPLRPAVRAEGLGCARWPRAPLRPA